MVNEQIIIIIQETLPMHKDRRETLSSQPRNAWGMEALSYQSNAELYESHLNAL